MAVRLISYREQIQDRIRNEMQRRLKVCARLVVEHAKELINIDGTGRAIRAHTYIYARKKIKVQKRGIVYGHDVSSPGEPPRKQYGDLLKSVAWEITEMIARIGSNQKHARFLELGTRRMAARPWLRRALREKEDEIKAILGAPIKQL